MSDTAIKIENLGKRYRYGGVAPLSDSLRTDLTDWAKGLLGLRAEKGPTGASHHESFREVQAHRLDADPNYFWALRDVNLEIKQGEVVGIIGRNGAGKSTLLKILSRITPPTTGTITYHGRVASLLEVGTGFHRELTGRENIFLNGSILGMKRAEITRRFDEIVAFAEIDKFIDTPVKFYSSGMYVRLAFAVAAHLQPEILIVDEVLAVGDAAFQKKCLGKMGEVAKQGRTILFVSHNLASIQELCTRCFLLRDSQIAATGDPSIVVLEHLGYSHRQTAFAYRRIKAIGQDNGEKAELLEVDLLNATGDPCEHIQFGEPFAIRMMWNHRSAIPSAAYAIRVNDDHEHLLFAVNTLLTDLAIETQGTHTVICKVETNVLTPGEYFVSVGCYVRPHTSVSVVDSCMKLVVVDVPFNKTQPFNIIGKPAFALQGKWEER